MPEKRSQHEFKRLVELAVADTCNLPRPGLWFCSDEVEAIGRPLDRLKVRATLHFLPAGSPFCCGEPGCHLGFGELSEGIGDHIRRAMRLRQALTVDFGQIGVNVHPGVRLTYGQAEG
ncbi:hypothetical protein EP7_004941 [Isosphaeraceae bacterium EP7]